MRLLFVAFHVQLRWVFGGKKLLNNSWPTTTNDVAAAAAGIVHRNRRRTTTTTHNVNSAPYGQHEYGWCTVCRIGLAVSSSHGWFDRHPGRLRNWIKFSRSQGCCPPIQTTTGRWLCGTHMCSIRPNWLNTWLLLVLRIAFWSLSLDTFASVSVVVVDVIKNRTYSLIHFSVALH